MINFDENHKLIWKDIDKKQVEIYLYFLQCELARHMTERSMTDQKAINSLRDKNELLAQLWRSAWERHRQDIVEIEALQRQIKEYFGVGL